MVGMSTGMYVRTRLGSQKKTTDNSPAFRVKKNIRKTKKEEALVETESPCKLPPPLSRYIIK